MTKQEMWARIWQAYVAEGLHRWGLAEHERDPRLRHLAVRLHDLLIEAATRGLDSTG
jgi:hypothetical protein